MKSKKILIGCFEPPGWGGASTSAYELFVNMHNDGHKVNYINLISSGREKFFKYLFNGSMGNPRHLPNVYNYTLIPPYYNYQNKLADLIQDISPDIILAVGWIAALILKKAAPDKKLIYLTSGCDQIKNYIQYKRLNDFLYLDKYMKKGGKRLALISKEEKNAVILSDLVITHSDMILSAYRYFYHTMVGKIYPDVIWFAEWIYKDAYNYRHFGKRFDEREVDVIFISSDWKRPEKNYKMVKKLVSHFKNLNIHVVGKVKEKHPGAVYESVVTDREKLYELLGNSKAIVSTSIFDSAPGVLFEASALGCNIITSKNCGNWQLCNEELLVDPFSKAVFRDKIKLSLNKKYPDNIDFFLQTVSYKKLAEIITLF